MAMARSLHVVFDGVMMRLEGDWKIGQKSITPIYTTVPTWVYGD